MRRLAAWIGAAFGGLALYHLLSRRRRPLPSAPAEAPAGDPAEELRRKLEESRALVGEQEAFEEAETTVDRADAPPEERRREVHERGRAAADAMRRERKEP